MPPIVVTAALPYSNDRLHLGHLRSTYLPSDVYVRFLRRIGEDVVYICATDEHGTPIALRAEKEGKTPKEIADRYHPLIKEDLIRMGCSFDIFSRTTEKIHYETTQYFFKKLMENGYIYEQEMEQLKCPKCNKFLPDRYVEGICPFCGFEGARGDACDSCGRYLRPIELKEPKCAICGIKPELVVTKHWFFKLTAFQDKIRDWLENNNSMPKNVSNYALNWIKEGLRDWCITRDLNWGVPVEGAEGKVIYVWFDAPIGYISSTKILFLNRGDPEGWKRYWNGRIIHFIGKDIIYHHAIFWPAMLIGMREFELPYSIVAGEYLTLEGKKMSKSRGWYIGIDEYLKLFDPDPMRYYLISVAPLDRDADFSLEDFIRKYNDELADILGNFIHRTLIFIEKYFNSKIPNAKLSKEDEALLLKIKDVEARATEYIKAFKFREALVEIISLAHEGNRYLNLSAPWAKIKENSERAATTLYVCAQIVKALGSMLSPFLPFTAEKIWNMLNINSCVHEQPWSFEPIPSGHEIGKPYPLFKKIKLEDLKRIRAALIPGRDVGEKISIEDFKKLKILTAKIVKAVKIENSNNLISMEIDLGEYGLKSCVAGIGNQYSPEELIGRNVIVLANIEPATIFGIKSEVMILAAEGGGKISIITPDKDVPAGSIVK
ncbi:MAG: methionine--tRNA ligase [Candidatus Methanomethyliaceae archaeon]|nr:methionine--tRNA ligase [Candidatus Methanomethyliaceae archaeon]